MTSCCLQLRSQLTLNLTPQQWFYAFSITPSAAPSGPPPANLTPSPFNSILSAAGGASSNGAGAGGPRGMKRAAGSLDTTGDVNEYGVPNYIFGGQGGGGERKKGRGAGGGPPPCVLPCLFALSLSLVLTIHHHHPTATTTPATSASKKATGSKNAPRKPSATPNGKLLALPVVGELLLVDLSNVRLSPSLPFPTSPYSS